MAAAPWVAEPPSNTASGFVAMISSTWPVTGNVGAGVALVGQHLQPSGPAGFCAVVDQVAPGVREADIGEVLLMPSRFMRSTTT